MIDQLSSYLFTHHAQSIINTKHVGICAICGRRQSNVIPLRLSDNFTAMEYLYQTEWMCQPCGFLLQTQTFRTSNWFVSQKEFVTLKWNEILPKLQSLTPADTPFLLYSTQTYKKQGWFLLISRLNYDREEFEIGYDMNVITLSQTRITLDSQLIRELASYKCNKTSMRKAEIPYYILKTIPDERRLILLTELGKRKNNIVWEWMLHFTELDSTTSPPIFLASPPKVVVEHPKPKIKKEGLNKWLI
jgi:hypothetical protein